MLNLSGGSCSSSLSLTISFFPKALIDIGPEFSSSISLWFSVAFSANFFWATASVNGLWLEKSIDCGSVEWTAWFFISFNDWIIPGSFKLARRYRVIVRKNTKLILSYKYKMLLNDISWRLFDFNNSIYNTVMCAITMNIGTNEPVYFLHFCILFIAK